MKSDTPRTDKFINEHAVKFPASVSFVVVEEVRDLMIAWADYARELEREVNQSIPKEWEK